MNIRISLIGLFEKRTHYNYKCHMQTILDHEEVQSLIQLALREDGVHNDLTAKAAEFGPSRKSVRAAIVAKKNTVIAGYPLVASILKEAKMNESIKASTLIAEGSSVSANAP